MVDSIVNKLGDLHRDLERRDSVAFRMHLHELARRGLCDADLDTLTASTWSTGFNEDLWQRLAERLAVVTKTHVNA